MTKRLIAGRARRLILGVTAGGALALAGWATVASADAGGGAKPSTRPAVSEPDAAPAEVARPVPPKDKPAPVPAPPKGKPAPAPVPPKGKPVPAPVPPRDEPAPAPVPPTSKPAPSPRVEAPGRPAEPSPIPDVHYTPGQSAVPAPAPPTADRAPGQPAAPAPVPPSSHPSPAHPSVTPAPRG